MEQPAQALASSPEDVAGCLGWPRSCAWCWARWDYPAGPFWFDLTPDVQDRIAEVLRRSYTWRRQKT